MRQSVQVIQMSEVTGTLSSSWSDITKTKASGSVVGFCCHFLEHGTHPYDGTNRASFMYFLPVMPVRVTFPRLSGDVILSVCKYTLCIVFNFHGAKVRGFCEFYVRNFK